MTKYTPRYPIFIPSKGRADKNFTDYRPGWRGTWSPGYSSDWKERQKTLGFK